MPQKVLFWKHLLFSPLLTSHSKTHHMVFVSPSSYTAVHCKVRGCNVLKDNPGVFLIRTIHWCTFLEIWTKALLSWQTAQNDNIYPICFNPFPHCSLHWISNFIRASKSNVSSRLGKHGIILSLRHFKSICWKTQNPTKTCL